MSSDTSGSYSDFFKSAVEIVEAGKKAGIQLRLLGATAIHYQCPSSTALTGALKRHLTDLDFITTSKYISKIPGLFVSMKFVSNDAVNTLYGAHRQIYYDPINSRQVDIFFDKLSFNHVLDLSRRLDLDPMTISIPDLLLEKLQIVKMGEKDAKDIIVLFNEHKVGNDSPHEVDAKYISKLLANDWGFYYTVTTNLKKVRDYLGTVEFISKENKEHVSSRIDELTKRIEDEPKSFGWKMRARIGTKSQWYTEAEDVEHRQA